MTTFFAFVNFSRRALNYKVLLKMITAGIFGQLFLEILAVSDRFNNTGLVLDCGIPFLSTAARRALVNVKITQYQLSLCQSVVFHCELINDSSSKTDVPNGGS